MLRESTTTVVERNTTWSGSFEAEPCEAAWASEATYFVRLLAVSGSLVGVEARVQVSPDGMHWCDEGTTLTVPSTSDTVTFTRVRHFGGWLRLVGELSPGIELRVIVYLVLKA